VPAAISSQEPAFLPVSASTKTCSRLFSPLTITSQTSLPAASAITPRLGFPVTVPSRPRSAVFLACCSLTSALVGTLIGTSPAVLLRTLPATSVTTTTSPPTKTGRLLYARA
jgi:hypothetical protein